MRKQAIIFSLVLLLGLPAIASAKGRRHHSPRTGVRAVVVQGYYPYWGWRDPFWGPYYYPYYVDTRGKIEIEDANDYDQVYVNGAYAGIVDDVDSMRLEPGSYNVKIVRQGRTIVDRTVYVVSGKKIEINVASELAARSR